MCMYSYRPLSVSQQAPMLLCSFSDHSGSKLLCGFLHFLNLCRECNHVLFFGACAEMGTDSPWFISCLDNTCPFFWGGRKKHTSCSIFFYFLGCLQWPRLLEMADLGHDCWKVSSIGAYPGGTPSMERTSFKVDCSLNTFHGNGLIYIYKYIFWSRLHPPAVGSDLVEQVTMVHDVMFS